MSLLRPMCINPMLRKFAEVLVIFVLFLSLDEIYIYIYCVIYIDEVDDVDYVDTVDDDDSIDNIVDI